MLQEQPSKLSPELRLVLLGGFHFLPELPGVDGGLAEGTAHDVFLEPTERLVDWVLSLRAGNLKRFVAK